MGKQHGRTPFAERRDHYQDLTDRVVAALEKGIKPWRRPWNGREAAAAQGLPFNPTTGREYRGVNVLVLAISAFALGGGDPRFCTYKQAAGRGWQVRRGACGTTVFYYKQVDVPDRDAPAEAPDRTKRIPLLRAYTVFNSSQIEGCPPYTPPDAGEAPWRRPEAAELILRNSGVRIQTGGGRAFYCPATDHIQLPPDASFTSWEGWAATALHEAAHATGHPSRLARDLSGRFGSPSYAKEELVGELTSLYVGTALAIPCDVDNHASYLDSWILAMKEDKRALFRAAADAQRAADYLLALHPDYALAHGEPGKKQDQEQDQEGADTLRAAA